MFKFNSLNKKPLEQGMLLLSEPYIDDDFFNKSVVFLCDHNEEGSFGFVLNNYIDSTLDELVEDINVKFKVSIGGPVETQNLYFIHTRPDLLSDQNEIIDGIFLGGDFDSVKGFINDFQINEKEIKFFLGYSGWAENQLLDELKNHSWLVSDFDKSVIFNHDSEDLWKDILSNKGGNYELISKYPEDPSLN